MPGNYGITTRASGSVLTATIYNTDHGVHVTYNTPGGCDDDSAGKTYWYETPDSNLGSLFLKGADIALAATLVPVGEFEFADVTGSGINVTGINTEAAGKRRKFRFANAVNLIHNATSLILPFGKIYRTYANEFVTFESLGSGNWIMSDYSGPHEPPGMGKEFLGASAPSGYVMQNAATLNCTTYEGLFTELVANLTQEGYPSAVGVVTFDNSNETITLVAHGLLDGDVVHFGNAGGTLPAEIAALTKYYVRDKTNDTFKITATRGGAALAFSDNGTGTNSVYKTFLAPDSRGRVDIGLDGGVNRITSESTNGGNSTTLRGTGGAQTHTLVTDEMPAHTHTTAIPLNGGVAGSNQTTGGIGNDPAPDYASSSTGGGDAHSNTQPWRAVTKIVRV